MATGREIFDLIKRLNRNEKGHFKKSLALYSKPVAKKYAALFDIFDKLKTYDEERLKINCRKESFAKKIKETQESLWNILMETLDNFSQPTNPFLSINAQLENIRVLQGKNLPRQSYKLAVRLANELKRDGTKPYFPVAFAAKHTLYAQLDSSTGCERTYPEF